MLCAKLTQLKFVNWSRQMMICKLINCEIICMKKRVCVCFVLNLFSVCLALHECNMWNRIHARPFHLTARALRCVASLTRWLVGWRAGYRSWCEIMSQCTELLPDLCVCSRHTYAFNSQLIRISFYTQHYIALDFTVSFRLHNFKWIQIPKWKRS